MNKAIQNRGETDILDNTKIREPMKLKVFSFEKTNKIDKSLDTLTNQKEDTTKRQRE